MMFNKEAVTKFIKELYENEDFYNFLRTGDSYLYRDFCYDAPNWVRYNNGVTRYVLWADELDFVVKFEFTDNHSDVSYNASEAFVYERAVESGLADHFAACELLTLRDFDFLDLEEINSSLEVLVMEKVSADEDYIEERSYDYQCELYCERNGFSSDDETARQEFYDSCCGAGDEDSMLEYAESLYADWGRFNRFLCTYSINDVHAGNWGWRGNDIDDLVLIDYGGYGHDILEEAGRDE